MPTRWRAGLMIKATALYASLAWWLLAGHSSLAQQPSTQRQLLQQQPVLTPQAAPADNGSNVLSLANNNTSLSPYLCVNSCAQGFQCVWQNAWAWSCNKSGSQHNYWVWEPEGYMRLAATDSFADWPWLCLDMCLDTAPSNGACSMTAGTNLLNVGWQMCTGNPNQIWEQQGASIVNAANGYCMSIAPVPCGHLGVCNTGLAQTGKAGTILSIVAEPCNSSSPSQIWHTLLWDDVTPPEFVFLNVSAEVVPATLPAIADKASTAKLEPTYFQATADLCLAVENVASCDNQTVAGAPVCAWRNVLLQPCMSQQQPGGLDQVWVFDETTSAVMALGGFTLQDNICLEACIDGNYGQGACSLIENNVGWSACTGAPEQQWTFQNGLLSNVGQQGCLHMQRYCVLWEQYSTLPLTQPRDVDGFDLSNCMPLSTDKPWAQVPFNLTVRTIPGIDNVVLGSCDPAQNTNTSTLLTFTQLAAATAFTSPLPKAKSGLSGGAIAGIVLGVCAAIVLLAALLAVFMLRRSSNHLKLERIASETTSNAPYGVEDAKLGLYPPHTGSGLQ